MQKVEKKSKPNKEGYTPEQIKNLWDGKPVTFKTLNEALFAFQGMCPVIPRNGEGKTPDGRTYKYGTLDDTMAIIKPIMQKVGLFVTQPFENNAVVTYITHIASGEKLKSDLPIGSPERSQDLGGRVTYLRRYEIASLLGLSLEPDTDAKLVISKSSDAIGSRVNTPAEEKEADRVMDIVNEHNAQGIVAVTRSEAFQKANAAIDACAGLEALALIRANIGKSVKLDDDEKVELISVLEAKEHALGNK